MKRGNREERSEGKAGLMLLVVIMRGEKVSELNGLTTRGVGRRSGRG